jgi:predicted extracellular nuclease
MKNIKFLFYWLSVALFLFVSVSAKAQDNKFEVAIVGFYNVENLFDTINDPLKNDEEFLPEGGNNWTSERYKEKLDRLAEVISQIGKDINGFGPDVLGLCEIENIHVIEDLINTKPLNSMNYGIVHYDSPDRRGVDVGLIYNKKRFKVIGSSSHKIVSEIPDFLSRDQLLVHGKLSGEEMYIIVNHWPSKSGGEKRSEPRRIEAAKLTKYLTDSLLTINPDANIIIMGDLNDNPDAKSVAKFLQAKGNKNKVKQGELFNPMYKMHRDGIGSYAFRDVWSMIDQIIVSSNLISRDYATFTLHSARVFNETFLQQKFGNFKGYPWRSFAGGAYIGGYSDHFPVYIVLARRPKV